MDKLEIAKRIIKELLNAFEYSQEYVSYVMEVDPDEKEFEKVTEKYIRTPEHFEEGELLEMIRCVFEFTEKEKMTAPEIANLINADWREVEEVLRKWK